MSDKDKYFGIEEDGANGVVTVSLERYRELLELEARVAVAIEQYEREKPYPNHRTVARIIGANVEEN